MEIYFFFKLISIYCSYFFPCHISDLTVLSRADGSFLIGFYFPRPVAWSNTRHTTHIMTNMYIIVLSPIIGYWFNLIDLIFPVSQSMDSHLLVVPIPVRMYAPVLLAVIRMVMLPGSATSTRYDRLPVACLLVAVRVINPQAPDCATPVSCASMSATSRVDTALCLWRAIIGNNA